MNTRTIWTAATLLLLSLAAGSAIYLRQHRLDQLSTECVTAFHEKNWRDLEVLARQWTDMQSAPAAQYWLGIALKEQGKFEAAFRAFKSIRLEGPRGIDGAVERMEILFHVFQKPLDAIDLADKLLERDRKLASPRRHLIYFHAMMLQRPELLQQIKLAIEDHVDLPEHYVYLLSMEELGFRDADEVTRKWTEATPESAVLHHASLARRIRTARAAVLSSPTPESAEEYAFLKSEIVPQLRDLGSKSIGLDTLLMLAMDDSDTDEASRLLSLVPDAAANDPCFWRYRGWYAMRTGDLEQAEQAYRQALELHPLAWHTRHEFASVLRLLDRGVEAAAVQAVAAQGSELVVEIHRLTHTQNVNFALLKRIANYSIDCKSSDIANGILRRQQTSLQ